MDHLSLGHHKAREDEQEAASMSPPGARRLEDAAVQLRNFFGDRQPETESAVLPRGGLIGLTEPLENVWQKFR